MDAMNLPKMWVVALGCMVGSVGFKRYSREGEYLWLMFLGVFAASILMSVDPILSLMGNYYCGWETGFLAILCYLSYQVGLNSENLNSAGKYNYRKLDIIITIAIIISALYCILQYIGYDNKLEHYRSFVPFKWNTVFGPSHRTSGVMGNPIWSSCLMVLGLPYMSPILYPIVLIGISTTKTRSAYAALAALICWDCRGGLMKRKAFVIILAIASIMALIGGVSDVERLALTRLSLTAFLAHPLVGWGPGTGAIWVLSLRDSGFESMMASVHTIEVHSHNLITNIMATQGILGLLSWGALFFFGFRVASDRTRGSMIAMLAFSMFNPLPQMAYIIIALSCGVDMSNHELQPCGNMRRYILVLLSTFILFRYSITMLADHKERIGDYVSAARIEPTEFFYSQRVSQYAEKSMSQHPKNPLVYFGAANSLYSQGKDLEGDVATTIGRSFNPSKVIPTTP